jgi:hypothetical protein
LGAGGGQKEGFAFEMHMALTTLPCTSALASDVTMTTRLSQNYSYNPNADCTL